MTLYQPTHSQLNKLDEILGSLEGRTIGLLGLGVAGRAMASYLVRKGANVIAADLRTELADDPSLSESLSLRLGPMSAATFADVEALVILLMGIKWEKLVLYQPVLTFVLKIKASCKLDHH